LEKHLLLTIEESLDEQICAQLAFHERPDVSPAFYATFAFGYQA